MYVHVLFKALPLVCMAASGESQVVNIAQGKGTKLSAIFVMKFTSSIFVMRLSSRAVAIYFIFHTNEVAVL